LLILLDEFNNKSLNMIGQENNEQLNLFIITSVLLIEEDDEDEPTWPKELYKLSFSNFEAGRGKLKQKRN
jgi:hypothetical protein